MAESDYPSVTRAFEMWQKSKATTAFTYAIYMDECLAQIREEQGIESTAYKAKYLEVKAAITAYQATCLEVGVTPYELTSEIRERVGMPA